MSILISLYSPPRVAHAHPFFFFFKVEITNCFAVPHAERGDEVAIGKDFNKQMLALHKKEVVVGWYASCSTSLVADTSSLIHDFYSTEAEDGDPVHLVVDTRLLEDSLVVKAYTSTPVLIAGEPMANLFHEVKLEMESTEAEAICLNEMGKNETTTTTTTTTKEQSGSTNLLQVSMARLLQLLDTTSQYVDEVVEGKRPPKGGMEISDALASVPRIHEFQKVFDDNLQDLLLVTYLSNITKTQLSIAEKLTATLGIE